MGAAVQRKIFRIEKMHMSGQRPASAEADDAELRHCELLNEIKSLRALAERGGEGGNADLAGLREELALIHDAVGRTKRELAALTGAGHAGPHVSRATGELNAVAGATEKATQKILRAAEEIDENAKTLAAAVKNEQGLAQDIQDQVVQIYEACNFQDLAGQRIGKVMVTLKVVEEHVARMLEIWNGIEQGKMHNAAASRQRPEGRLVNGPKLNGDPGHASQRDIDKMFN